MLDEEFCMSQKNGGPLGAVAVLALVASLAGLGAGTWAVWRIILLSEPGGWPSPDYWQVLVAVSLALLIAAWLKKTS